MEIEKNLLVYFNRETTVDEFVEIFDGVLRPADFISIYDWSEDCEVSVLSKRDIEVIGKQFVRKSSDTVAILVMKDGNFVLYTYCSLDYYQKTVLYNGWHVIPVDDFIMKYRPELKQNFYFEDELMNLLCPLGGDGTNDCAYDEDDHFVDGKCVRRDD